MFYLFFKIILVQEKIDTLVSEKDVTSERPSDDFESHKKTKSTSSFSGKLKTSHKIKAQTSKIVSSFKNPSVSCAAVRDFNGHKDGIWEVATKPGFPLLGTASADKTTLVQLL